MEFIVGLDLGQAKDYTAIAVLERYDSAPWIPYNPLEYHLRHLERPTLGTSYPAIVQRVAYLLDNGIPPESILLLTFTNKAAREMLERVQALVPVSTDRLWGGTFHSIGNRLLRQHAELVGFRKGFSIMDREDQKALMDVAIASSGIDVTGFRLPKADVLAATDAFAKHLRNGLMGVGSKVGARVVGKSADDAARIVNTAIREALTDLSDIDAFILEGGI